MKANHNRITDMQPIIFSVYKPKGITSYSVVRKIKKITGIKKVGHGGTLDPLARGVLVVAVGKEATTKLYKFIKGEKTYIAKIRLGITSTTHDREGQLTLVKVNSRPEKETIIKTLKTFVGSIFQTPPKFSANKINGKRAYELARQGKDFSLEKKKVYIKRIDLIEYSWPLLTLKVESGAGVYIRALARDIGKKLKCGAYLYDLERIHVGRFEKKHTIDFTKLNIFLNKQKAINKNQS